MGCSQRPNEFLVKCNPFGVSSYFIVLQYEFGRFDLLW